MDDVQNNPFAPPRAAVGDVQAPADESTRLASLGARLGAALIDGLVNIALFFAVMLPLYGLSGIAGAAGRSHVLPGQIAYYVLAYAVEGFFLHRSSQTIGKIALGIRIVRLDGRHAGFVRTFWLRTIAVGAVALVPFIGWLLVLIDIAFIFGTSRRCIHDQLAGTIVVQVSTTATATLAMGDA